MFLFTIFISAFIPPILCGAARGGFTQPNQPALTTPAPLFISRGQTYRAVIGDTLVLPCEVQDLGKHVLLWRRGNAVVTADKLIVTRDPRFRLIDGYNLEIGNVMPQDAGDYVCQIGDYRDQINTVEILVPPSIRPSPASGTFTARKGGTVTLECKASGNPVPTILWTRKDDALPSGEKAIEGISITLEKVDRHQAGIYQCTASNGVGDPVSVDIELHVLYPPEIEVERSWVHSEKGNKAQLVCIVHGEPPPNMNWYQDSFVIEPTERRSIENNTRNRLALLIKDIQNYDFGNYSCSAENKLGKARKYIELSGKPSPAKFTSSPFSRFRESYNLTWHVDSYPELEEVRLLYRKLMMDETPQNQGNWHDVILKPSTKGDFSHNMSYDLRGLEPGSNYEAIVQAKNVYGWNEVSESMQFQTRGPSEDIYDYPSEPHVDMELVASSAWHQTWSPLSLITFTIILYKLS